MNTPIYCINLDRRPDRWQTVSEIFLKQSLDVNRWPAIDSQAYNISGPTACLRSHMDLLNFCKNREMDSVIIFEDDVILCHNFIQKLNTIINHLPSDWEIVTLSSFKAKTNYINEYVVKLLSPMYGTHGMLLNIGGITKTLKFNHTRCLEEVYHGSVENFYGVALEHTLAFQNGIDSDIPETSIVEEYKSFLYKYKHLVQPYDNINE